MEASALPRGGRVFAPRSRRLLAAFSDERLVEQVRQGNDIAFEVVYDRHHNGILSFCRHMLGTREEAEDAVQHAFIAAYNDLLASDRPIKLKAWLYAIARNRCLSVLRSRREQPAEEVDVSTVGLAEQVQERQELRELLADMRDLPHEQRAALVLAELGDLSHSDIGEVLGVEGVKVKSLVFQARSTLIESRDARDIPCQEIREQLATLRGGALRRAPLRKHLKACQGCRDYREQVRRQRTMMAAVLPVIPTVGLKHSALAAIGGGFGGGGGAAAAAGGAAAGSAGSAGGGVLSGLGSAGIAAKAAVAIAVGGAAVGGGVVIEKVAQNSSVPSSVEQGTAQRSSVAAQGQSGSAGVTDTIADIPSGVARRVRAHGFPSTKHHNNLQALINAPAVPNGHANGVDNGGKGNAYGQTSSGNGQAHTPNGQANGQTTTGGNNGNHNGPTANTGNANGHSTTTTTTTTPTVTVPGVPGGNAYGHLPKDPHLIRDSGEGNG